MRDLFTDHDKMMTLNDGLGAAYRAGFAGHPCRYVKTSLAEAAWRAGRERAEQDRRRVHPFCPHCGAHHERHAAEYPSHGLA